MRDRFPTIRTPTLPQPGAYEPQRGPVLISEAFEVRCRFGKQQSHHQPRTHLGLLLVMHLVQDGGEEVLKQTVVGVGDKQVSCAVDALLGFIHTRAQIMHADKSTHTHRAEWHPVLLGKAHGVRPRHGFSRGKATQSHVGRAMHFMCACTCVCVRAPMCACARIHACMCSCACACVRVLSRKCACVCARTWVHVHVCVGSARVRGHRCVCSHLVLPSCAAWPRPDGSRQCSVVPGTCRSPPRRHPQSSRSRPPDRQGTRGVGTVTKAHTSQVERERAEQRNVGEYAAGWGVRGWLTILCCTRNRMTSLLPAEMRFDVYLHDTHSSRKAKAQCCGSGASVATGATAATRNR